MTAATAEAASEAAAAEAGLVAAPPGCRNRDPRYRQRRASERTPVRFRC